MSYDNWKTATPETSSMGINEDEEKQEADTILEDAIGDLERLEINKEYYSAYFGGELLRQRQIAVHTMKVDRLQKEREELYEFYETLD